MTELSTITQPSDIGEREVSSVTCPDWCREPDCRGEHRAEVGDYVPATAGLPQLAPQLGATFPVVGVQVGWDTLDHLQPCISLHISGENIDEQPDLHLHEARQLIANLQRAVDILEGRA